VVAIAISGCAAPEVDELALASTATTADAGAPPRPSRRSLALTRLRNTVGDAYCRFIGTGGCQSLVAARRGPHGEFRPFSYDVEYESYDFLDPVLARDELEADPRFGPDEERQALAAFKRWESVQPRSPYVVSTEFALLVPLIVEPERVGLSVAKVIVLNGSSIEYSIVFQRRVVWLDGNGRELASVPGRPLRVWPDGRILVDQSGAANEIGDPYPYLNNRDSILGMYLDGAPVPGTIRKGFGRVMPSYIWPAGPSGGYVVVSTSFTNGEYRIDPQYSRLDGVPAPAPTCGELLPLHERRDPAAPVDPDGAEARAIVRYANTAESEDSGYMYDVSTAWARYRNGPDQRPFTRDDNLFDNLDEVVALGATPSRIASKLYGHDYLVNPCVTAADEARALAIYRTWRRVQDARLDFQFLGPVLVAPDKVALAIKSGGWQSNGQVHRYFVLWLDDSARVLERIDAIPWHLSPGGGAFLGWGANWVEGYNQPGRPTQLNLMRIDAAGPGGWGPADVDPTEIWPLRDSGRLLTISRDRGYGRYPGVPGVGESSMVDVMTLQPLDRPWGIPPEPSLGDGW
jgi:hypothetical protein